VNGLRCSQYYGRERCTTPADVWLVAPDGHKVPGCWYCQKHANVIIAEYNMKLGELWSTVRLEVLS
jgi:hypothetical protein